MPSSISVSSDSNWRIDYDRIIALFGPTSFNWLIEIVEKTDSTNTDLIIRMRALPRNISALARQPIVRIAYFQAAGRGCRGRSWHAKLGNALLFSIACVMPRPPKELAGLSLAIGVALIDGLRSLPIADSGKIALKWPNDILLEGNKLAGILVEIAWSSKDATVLVIGIGINIKDVEGVVAQMEEPHSSVSSFGLRSVMPTALVRVLPNANFTDTLIAELTALRFMLQQFAVSGFMPFQARWNAYHAYAGHNNMVLIEQGVEIARGIAIGVDEHGQLLFNTSTKRLTISTGNVSLRQTVNLA